MIKKMLVWLFVVGFVLLSLIVFYAQKPLIDSSIESTILIEIKKGQTLSQLAHTWEKQGWLVSADLLLLQARLLGGAKKIRPGEFEISSKTKTYQLLNLLAVMPSKRYKISFIEGTRLTDALSRLKTAPKLVQDIVPLTPQNVQETLKIKQYPEGKIYPDTYIYQSGDTVSSVLKRANQRLDKILQEEWQSYLAKVDAGQITKLPFNSAYEALVMASIVEKETGQASERPEIAGVFVRRLNKNMRLETDPTVIYGLGEQYEGNLKRKHLHDRSNSYNTYRNKGLPPTPIALAGREAINATLNPQAGKTLYFVAKGDGSHYFSSTLAEHNRAVREYQILKRKKDYRSAPASN